MEHYKEILRRCPNHGFEDWVQIELFYNGLNGQTRTTVDAAAGGTIFVKTPDEVYDLLEKMIINSFQWPSERSGVKKPAGMYSIDSITSLTAQVYALVIQIAAMSKGAQPNTEVAEVVSPMKGPTLKRLSTSTTMNMEAIEVVMFLINIIMTYVTMKIFLMSITRMC